MTVDFVSKWAVLDNRPALVFSDGTMLDYRDLAARIDARLVAWGAERRLILWEANAEPASLVTYLAALKGGHPILPIAPRGDDRHDAVSRNLIERYRPGLVCTRGGDEWRDEGRPHLHPALAVLLSTSGSTGSSKLVRLSADNVTNNATAIADYQGLTRDDRAALFLPLHYSYGLSVLHAHLAAGASIYVGNKSLAAAGALDEIAAFGCTNLAGVPYSFDLLEQIGFRDRMPASLRFMTVAGGRLAPDLAARYAAHLQAAGGQFFIMYGQTEATARIAYLPPDLAVSHPDCIGHAIPGGELSLVDAAGGEITGTGQAGELVYRGPNVMMGYARSHEDLEKGPELDRLKTGDLAERVAGDLYRIVGRLSRFSKIAGLRIAHDEIERQLSARGIAAFVTGDDKVLQVAVSGDAAIDPVAEIVAGILGLPQSFVRVVPFAALPRLATGKPDYAAIRARAATSPGIGMDDPVMEAFVAAFAPRRVTARDSFDSLGGDSLAYLQLSLALEAHFGAVPVGWERRSIGELSVPQEPQKAEAGWRRWLRPASIDSDLALRAVAISLVVLHHATMWPLAGGAAVLLLLVGYNLARFHATRLFEGDGLAVLRLSLRPVLIYYPLLLAYCLYQGEYPWQSLLLIGNWGIAGYSTMPSAITPYWFIEAYLQILLIALGLFSIPPLRRWVRGKPFVAGLVFLAASIILRETVNDVWDAGEMNIFFTPRILYVPVLGWCIFFAAGRTQRGLMAALVILILVGLPYFEGNNATILWVRAAILITAGLVLVALTRLVLPLLLARLLMLVAGASFSIYLFHNLPYYLWLDDGIGGRDDAALHFILGILTGIALHFALLAGGRWWRGTRIVRKCASLWPVPARLPAGE